jgi:endonuclease YncB( thermonuclease family)
MPSHLRPSSSQSLIVALAIAIGAAVLGCGGPAAVSAPVSAPASSPAPAGVSTSLPTASAPSTLAPDGVTAAEAFATRPEGPTERARVVRVVDGDTIIVDRGRGNERVRYIGMDTPESVKPGTPVEFMAKEASVANAALVDGRVVLLEKDVSETDRYGRLLRYAWIEDPTQPDGLLMVNLALVARGYAQVATYPPDVRYVDAFRAAERAARDAQLGLWGPVTPAP